MRKGISQSAFPNFLKTKNFAFKSYIMVYEVMNLPLLLVDRKELMRDSGIM